MKSCGYIRERGFRQRALGVNKSGTGGDGIHVVTIQRGARSLLGSFTVELGIFLPAIQPLVWPTLAVPEFPRAYECSVNGTSIAGLKDTWWKSDEPRAFSEIKLLFDRHGWSFLDH